jgi:hypothetical protein
METVPSRPSHKVAQRVTVVLALLCGIPLHQVTAQFGICCSDLYKLRHRALTTLYHALEDHPRGPKRPHNRLALATEQRIAALCPDDSTTSATVASSLNSRSLQGRPTRALAGRVSQCPGAVPRHARAGVRREVQYRGGLCQPLAAAARTDHQTPQVGSPHDNRCGRQTADPESGHLVGHAA